MGRSSIYHGNTSKGDIAKNGEPLSVHGSCKRTWEKIGLARDFSQEEQGVPAPYDMLPSGQMLANSERWSTQKASHERGFLHRKTAGNGGFRD